MSNGTIQENHLFKTNIQSCMNNISLN